MNDVPTPDIEWYMSISRARKVTPRCPFASAESCPRYYQSLSLLGEVGSTRIPPEEDARLEAIWTKSDLWPTTGEQATSLSGGNRKTSFSQFCPEVSYDRFHVFASSMIEHFDEIDREYAYERFRNENLPSSDWRWQWLFIKPTHFTECPLYSPLEYRKENGLSNIGKNSVAHVQPKILEKIIELNLNIRDKIGTLFQQGSFDTAIFEAMKAVEVAVRAAAGLTAADIGINLVRKAFHPQTGPLTDLQAEMGEREALSNLFAGAIGSYKNPHSHRQVSIDDPAEAIEIILLANLLLRIVESRRVSRATP